MKTAVVYWSGTGNTEAMARAVAEGMTAAGADVRLVRPQSPLELALEPRLPLRLCRPAY